MHQRCKLAVTRGLPGGSDWMQSRCVRDAGRCDAPARVGVYRGSVVGGVLMNLLTRWDVGSLKNVEII